MMVVSGRIIFTRSRPSIKGIEEFRWWDNLRPHGNLRIVVIILYFLHTSLTHTHAWEKSLISILLNRFLMDFFSSLTFSFIKKKIKIDFDAIKWLNLIAPFHKMFTIPSKKKVLLRDSSSHTIFFSAAAAAPVEWISVIKSNIFFTYFIATWIQWMNAGVQQKCNFFSQS